MHPAIVYRREKGLRLNSLKSVIDTAGVTRQANRPAMPQSSLYRHRSALRAPYSSTPRRALTMIGDGCGSFKVTKYYGKTGTLVNNLV